MPPSPEAADPSRPIAAGVCGLLAVLLNVLGVLPLDDIHAAYKPGRLLEWYTQIQEHTTATALSALAFSLGVLLLPLFAPGLRALAPRSALLGPSGILLTLGGVINSLGSLCPLVVAWQLVPTCPVRESCAPAASALLGLALTTDALFNLLLGLSLILGGAALFSSGHRRLGLLGALAGALTVPVAAQVRWVAGADWLAVAGPCWLLWIAAASVVLIRGSRGRAGS